ncbi:MAG: penicillin-binding protein 2 [Ignavibacteriales bacterium]|nr:penicillin-binding protein 2 [Ignavibacteriales bacterium]
MPFSQETQLSTNRKIFSAVIIGVFLVFFFRLIQLQMIYRPEYQKQSEENSIRQVVSEATRGFMFDRHGHLAVDVRPSYTVMVIPSEFDKSKIDQLSKILQTTPEYIQKQVRRAREYNPYIPSRLKRDLDFPTLSMLEEHRSEFPGIDYQIETKRFYVTRAKASHILGYVKEISEKQLNEMQTMYRQGDLIGATGLESAYEPFLRGQPGIELISIDAHGRIVGKFSNGTNDIRPNDGTDLMMTMDFELQEFAESLMADKRGAIVAIDPQDGGILAMVSKPDYDLNWFGGATTQEQWKYLNSDDEKPLFNRATLTRYPPGSTFKMVLAAAALEAGIITTDWRVQCTGKFRFGNHVFADMHVHGSTDVYEAIQRSCNVYFYTLMLKTGFKRWTEMGRRFGFGQPTNVDIDEENSGLLPSEEYFDKVYGKKKWTQGYLVSLSIGQGELGVTPLQMANFAAAIGNGGTLYQPHTVAEIRERVSGTTQKITGTKKKVGLPKEVMDVIREGMRRVVMEPGGTASTARIKGIDVAGKTGTAQNPHGNDHAWFVGFAPFDNPKIAICVLIENGGKGGAVSAPIAGLCMEKYLFKELIRNKPVEQAKKVVAVVGR